MKAGPVDRRFAPVVAVFSGLIGGLIAVVARYGWQFAWPVIGLLVCGGMAALIVIVRRRRRTEMPYWSTVIATSLALTGVVAAIWGVAGGVAL